MQRTTSGTRASKRAEADTRPRCGLCGKTRGLTRTECCGQWICDDEGSYVLFSYGRNSCSRNHRRYTLCGFHCNEGHAGAWQDCKMCRKSFEAELYAHFGTNEYNFVKLENPPSFEPTRCADCNKVIRLGTDGYMISGRKKVCSGCAPF